MTWRLQAHWYRSANFLTRTNVRPPPQEGHFTSGASRGKRLATSAIRSFPRCGLRATCWAAPPTEVADVASWNVQDVGALATCLATAPGLRRLETGCRLDGLWSPYW